MNPRILYGLDRLPRGMAPDDPRLPGVAEAGGLLRLNTIPLPRAVQAEAAPTHPARIAAMRSWLEDSCGDYARTRRAFVAAYLDLIAEQIARHRPALEAGLARFGGLYAPEDWFWSAPRPLPRAWLPSPSGPVFAEIAFRLADGPLALVFADRAPEPALRAAGITLCHLGRDALCDRAALEAALGDTPGAFWPGAFWENEVLPRSPFRRDVADLPAPAPD